MKTLKKLFLLIALTGLLFSCSKSDQFFDTPGMSEKDHKGHPYTHEKTIVVEPNGTDDTEDLINAFAEASDWGPDAVVQLKEGTYFIDFIEIREFNGKFRGAGKGKTIITALDVLDIEPLTSLVLNTFLIKFVGGDIYLSDMTIKTSPGLLTTNPDEWWIEGLLSFSARNRQYASIDDYIRVVVNNVEFISGEGAFGYKSNCNNGLFAGFDSRYETIEGGWPLSPIDLSITNCKFENFDIYGAQISYNNGGKFLIGTKNSGNVFINNSTSAYGFGGDLALWHNVNVEISISGNTFNNPTGSRFGIEMNSGPYPELLEQVAQTKFTVCNVEHNTFNIPGGTGGILINDRRRYFFPDERPMFFQAKSNKFNLSNGGFTGIGCFSMYGMVICNNIFNGSSQYGVRIMAQAPNPYNENGLMLGNNLSNLVCSVATVLLNNLTRNWTIVGSNLEEGIIDNGENNVIKNMKIEHSSKDFGPFNHEDHDKMKYENHNGRGH